MGYDAKPGMVINLKNVRYMRNSFLVVLLVVLTGFQAYAQEFETDSVKSPLDSKTVDLGFGIVQSRTLTTASIATVGSEELNQRAAINLNDALYGRLLGLTALKGGGWAGDVDYGASYNSRGIQTLTEKNILILVDGLERTIDELSLDEIESVTLLKDAAATALYGYRGINGILDVKTKRGPQSGLVISAKYHHKFTFGALTPDYADAYTYALALNEARDNDGYGPVYNQHELNAFQNNTYPLVYPNVDWKKETMRDMGSEDVLSVSVANGGERLKYFTMLNYTNSHGLLDGTERNKPVAGYSTQLKYSKANIRANLDFDVTRTTRLKVNMLGILSESNRPSSLSAYELFDVLYRLPSAAFPVRTEDGFWGGDNNFASINPVARIQETGYRREFATTLFADFQLTQSLDNWVEGLSLSGRIGYDNYSRIYENRNRAFQYASDRYTFNNDGSIASTVRQSGGNHSNSLTFDRGRLGKDENSDDPKYRQGYWRRLNVILSADYQKRIDEHNMAASVFYSQNQSVTPGRYQTFFRHNISSYLHYDLSGKYIADAVLMYSGSNRSYPVKWAFSPTVSFGWILSEEDFLKGNDIVNFLKLRASAGILHTDYVPRQGLWLSDYVWSYNYYWGTTGGGYSSFSGTRLDYLPTGKFKLETANKYNLGIDVSLLKSLDLTIEGYYQRRHNILMSESGVNSAILGLAPAYINKGIVDSRGVEVGLNYDRTFGDFRVNIGGMFTYGVNKVVDIAEEPKAFPYMELKGQPVESHRGLEAIGFFKDEADIQNSPTQMFALVTPGDVKYKDQNGDNVINENDFVPIGYSGDVPEINYAFNIGFEWKGFGFNALFQGASHFTKWYIPGVSRPLVSRNNISLEYYENRWAPGQDNTNAKYPRLASGSNPNNEQNSTIWYRDASFFKLRHCEIYYRSNTISRYIKELKLSVRGENLFTSSGIDLIDPENPYAGYPALKGVSVGVSLIF